MNLTILDTNLEPLAILDTYESLIWTDRYQAYGDFEIYESVRDDGLLSMLKQDYYLENTDSDHIMIIEQTQISSDTDSGNHLKIRAIT